MSVGHGTLRSSNRTACILHDHPNFFQNQRQARSIDRHLRLISFYTLYVTSSAGIATGSAARALVEVGDSGLALVNAAAAVGQDAP